LTASPGLSATAKVERNKCLSHRVANGEKPGAAERSLYRVTVPTPDGTTRDIVPATLADLGDGDNNHLLCLDTADKPVSVAFPAGIFTDPHDDLNPETSVSLAPS